MRRAMAWLLTVVMVLALLPPVMAAEETATVLEAVELQGESLLDSAALPGNDRVAVEPLYDDDDLVTVIVQLEEPPLMDSYATSTYSADAALTPGEAVSAYLSTDAVRAEAKSLLAAQDALAADIADLAQADAVQTYSNAPVEVLSQWTVLLNGMAVEVPYGLLADIRTMDGVKRAYVARTFAEPEEPVTDAGAAGYSYDMVNLTTAWEAGYTGKGMLVAVLDTGLDLDWRAYENAEGNHIWSVHEAFTDDSFKSADAKENLRYNSASLASFLLEHSLNAETRGSDVEVTYDHNALYKNLKVPFAYDYADLDLNVQPTDSDHGTHVSGTVAGYAADAEGVVTFSGVAPDAQILAMKVFGDASGGAQEDSIIDALEDAMQLGADVINLSLGSDNGFAEDDTAANDVYELLESAGILLMTSAGNAGYSSTSNNRGDYNLSSDPEISMMSAPAVYDTNLSVASINNTVTVQSYFTWTDSEGEEHRVVYNDPTGVAMKYKFAGQEPTSVIPVDGYGTVEDYANAGFVAYYSGYGDPGKTGIALVQRGELSFTDKINNATRYAWSYYDYRNGTYVYGGVQAVIVYDNVEGELVTMSTDGTYLTSCFISKADGEAIVAAVEAGYDVRITVAEEDQLVSWDQGYEMSVFSSWGAGPGLELKPEITAPGGNIWSTVTGGASADGSTGAYGMMSGTSMAAPHMTGIGALVEQYVRETKRLTTKQDIADLTSQLLVSTAVPQTDASGVYYSPRLQGAGLVNTGAAVTTPTYITVAGQNVGKLELMDDPDWTGSYEFAFQLNNMTTEALTYEVQAVLLRPDTTSDGTHTYLLDSDVEIKTVSLGSVTVPGTTSGSFASTQVTGTLSLTAEEISQLQALFPNGTYVEGYILLTAQNGTDPQIGLPFLAFLGDWTAAPILDNTTWLDEPEADGQSYFDNDYTWFPTVFGYYDGYGFYNLGQNIFDGTSGETQTVYYEGNLTLAPGTGVFQMINDINLYQLREAKLVVVEVRDAETGELYYRDEATYQFKTVYDANYAAPIPSSLYYFTDKYWNGTDLAGNVLPSGTDCVYTVTAYGEGDYGEAVYNADEDRYVSNFEAVDPTDPTTEPTFNGHGMDKTGDTLSFHVLVDTEAPRLTSNAVSIYEEGGRTYLTGTFTDDGALALVQVAPVVTRTSKYNPDYSDTTVATGDSFFTEYIYDEATQSYTFVADVTEYTHIESYPGESYSYDFTWTGAVYIYGGDYGGNERVYAVAVNDNSKAPGTINLSQTSALLYVGDSFDLSVVDNTGAGEPLTRSSSNPEVATIDEFGHITALAPGQTVITVSNSVDSAVCIVAVRERTTEVLDFDLALTDFSGLKPNGTVLVQVVNLYPADVQLTDISWVISETEETAEFYEGLVTVSQYTSDGLSGQIYLNYSATNDPTAEVPGGEAILTVTLNGVSRELRIDWEDLYTYSNDDDLVSDISYGDQTVYVTQGETATLVAKYNDTSAHNVIPVALYSAEGCQNYSYTNPTEPSVGLALDGPTSVGTGMEWRGKLVNEENYALPETIQVGYSYPSGDGNYEYWWQNNAYYTYYTYDPATGEIWVRNAPYGSNNTLIIRADGVESEGTPAGSFSGETYDEVEPLYGPFDWAATEGTTLTGELTTAEGVTLNNATKNVAYYTPDQPGVSYLTATTKDGQYSCNFAVICLPVKATSLDMTHSLNMLVGETATLEVTMTPQPTLAEDEELIWTSYNPDVVAVDDYGTLTALSVGYAYIRVCTRADTSVATYCIVQVESDGSEHEHQLMLINQKDATCTETGYTGDWVCSVCGETVSEGYVIEPLGHREVLENYRAPTATRDGYSGDWVCARCGLVLEYGVVLPATGIPEPEVPSEPPVTDDDGDDGDNDTPVTTPAEPGLPFIDVSEGDYFFDAVKWAVENGITMGTSETTFSPARTVTRAEMVTFLWRAFGAPTPVSDANPFTDVSADDYYYEAVLWAVESGITQGTSETTFSPERTVTRAEAVTFLWRAAGTPAASGDRFEDVPADAYYAAAVAWAVENGITVGTGAGTFSPERTVTRAEAVTFLYRFLG